MRFKHLIHTLGFALAVLTLPACSANIHQSANQNQNNIRSYHAKQDTIVCMTYHNLKYLHQSMLQSDYATVNTLLQQKACYVVPTDQEIFISEFRDNGEVVNAHFKDDPFGFWVLYNNLY